MLSQETWHDPYRTPSGLDWWLMPRNPPSDLTEVGAHLRAVWALPDNQHVWAGGGYAMLLHSHDEGRTWNRINLDIAPASQKTAAPATKAPALATPTPATPTPAPPKPAPTGNRLAPGISLDKGGELPPAQNQNVQGPLNAANAARQATPPVPYGNANPSTIPVGATVRMQITTVNFRIEKPNATALSPFIKLGAPELAKDPSVLFVPVSVDPKTPPGPYTITIYGARLADGSGYQLTVEFTVAASSPKSAAGLLWRLPGVYAAEPPTGEARTDQTPAAQTLAGQAQTSVPGASIVSVEFDNETSGSFGLESGEYLQTRDGGGVWNVQIKKIVPTKLRGDCFAGTPSTGTFQCWGTEVVPHLQQYLKVQPPPSPPAWQSVFALDPNHVWVGGANGSIQARDGSTNWQTRNAPTKARINGLFFQPDGKRGWAVGSTGVILSTADGGQHWSPMTKISDAPYQAPYSAGPAPWYILSLFGTGFLLLIALVPPPAQVVTPAIEVIGASDRPLENDKDPDPLSFGPIARGLAYFIRNRRTNPPLNFAITGPWG
ncbi:MAG: YCF48-related protein, partial [Acidobacteriota bacterium]